MNLAKPNRGFKCLLANEKAREKGYEALALYNEILDNNPRDGDSLTSRANLKFSLGDREGALEDIISATFTLKTYGGLTSMSLPMAEKMYSEMTTINDGRA